MIKVVNRSILSHKPDAVIFNVMRGHSALSNPYKSKSDSRDERIAKYRVWLWRNVKSKNKKVLGELFRIKKSALKGDVYLMCCCKPARCHADIIKSCVEWCISKS